MKNRNKYLCLIIILVFTIGSTVIAEPLNNQLQRDKSSLAEVKDKRQELELKIEHFDVQIEETMRKVDKNKKEIVVIQKDIEKTTSDLVNNEKDIKEKQKLFNERMKVLYINGTESYFDILVNADGLNDFISKAIALKKIAEYDKNISAQLRASKEKLQAEKDKLEKRKETIFKLSKENEEELVLLKENKKQQETLLVQAKGQEKVLASNIKQTQDQINALLDKVNKPNPVINPPSLVGGNYSNNDVIAYATQFLGIPYLWGGTSPRTGFDCSGFTQYVYAHFGISLGRTTYDQINNGSSISKSELKPGDLVFFGTINNPHHMGIYMGDNYYIHAPRTGDVVKISPMTRSDFIKGVRVR